MKLMILFCLFLHIVISTQKSPAQPRSIDPNYRPIPKSLVKLIIEFKNFKIILFLFELFRVFTVVAPTAIRQGKPFDVHIRGFNIKESIYLTIRINGTTDEDDKLKVKKYATISRSSSKKAVTFDVSMRLLNILA